MELLEKRGKKTNSWGLAGGRVEESFGVKDGLCVGVQSITVGCAFDVRGAPPALGLGRPKI